MQESQELDLIDYDQVQATLESCQWKLTASELHGYQVGLIVLGLYGSEQFSRDHWLGRLAVDYPFSNASPMTKDDLVLLQQLWFKGMEGLESDSFEFDLLLPDDEASLILRVTSLSEWCSGFLSGFQTALTLIDASVRGRIHESEEVKEILIDLAAIRQAEQLELNDVDDLLETERNYAQITEYVRVAIMNIYMEVNLGLLDDAKASKTSH